MASSLLFAGVVFAGGALAAAQGTPRSRTAETYVTATIDAGGQLAIRTDAGRTVVVPKVADQTTFKNPVVSQDRTAVGAQALFPNCCTSYDLPLQLVVYSRGKVHHFRGNGLPIFHWGFVRGGSQVAFGQEPVHFGCEIYYERREVHSERLIDTARIPQPCGQIRNQKRVRIPAWVKAVESR